MTAIGNQALDTQKITHTGLILSLLVLFFISGFSSLCYQIVWQRMLFSTFGIHIESVTIIISLFMFGLGIGALASVKLQKYPRHLLGIFIAFELLIAVFGIMSPALIAWLGSLHYIDSLWRIALSAYALFAVPTLLMGATLPVLVGYIDRFIGHTGKSTGWLYASNTLGAAVAAWAVVALFFVWWGLNATIEIAASLNALTALFGCALYAKYRTRTTDGVAGASLRVEDTSLAGLPHALLLIIGCALGYISLSQELVLYKILGFMTASKPQAFGFLLAAFLGGIALSSITASRICAAGKNTYRYIFYTLLLMLFVWYVSLPVLAYVTGHYGHQAGVKTALLLACATAYLSGGIFPVLCDALKSHTRYDSGRAVGTLYFVNVMGATAGPLVTGFIIFEYFSIQETVLYIGIATAIIMLLLAGNARARWQPDYTHLGMVGALTLFGCIMHHSAYENFLEKLQFAKPNPSSYVWLTTNRSGIISIMGDTVYGNGAYDGRMNIHPDHERNTNGIDRAYAVPAIHPNPKRILQIGLSSGSWAKAISMYAPLEELVVVEINKGYSEIIRHYPDHADILENPKIRLVIDDGRRWLRNHPHEKFDMIVMNTTLHWRSNATNMLSREFMELCKRHLNPGGYIYINRSGAQEVLYTAAHVFDYVADASGTAPDSMLIAGDVPSVLDEHTKTENLKKFIHPDGQAVFESGDTLADIAQRNYPNQKDAMLGRRDLRLITDDNMATEFKK